MAMSASEVDVAKNVYKREPKLTEKAIDAKLNSYIGGRRVKFRQLLSKIKATEDLFGGNSPYEEMAKGFKDFDVHLSLFKQLNLSVLKYLNKDEHSVDQEDWFQPKVENFLEFRKRVHLWLMENENKLDENGT